MLSLEGLSHRYDAHEVLKGLDLSLERGEILGLLGPNGSGKSTVFAILAGLLPRQAGRISFQQNAIDSGDRVFHEQLGVVFQSPALDPRLSCRQNLELAAMLRGIGGTERKTRVNRQLERAALTARAEDLVSNLSGGMRRRLDISRALLHEPQLLLMDEPTAGLDEAAFRATWEHLKTAQSERQLTVLLTTHRPEEAERCDRIAVLQNGAVSVVDTPAALQAQVSSDVVVITAQEPALLQQAISDRFSVPTLLEGAEILVECERGHEWIPRLVEAFPDGRIATIGLRRPSLGDVFLKMTGASLQGAP